MAELEKVVALRQERLTYAMELVRGGVASDFDVQAEQEAVAQARAELARSRQAAVQRAGGEWLSKLNEALMGASGDLLSRNAELKTVETLLADIEERKLLELVNRYDREVRLEREMAEDAVREALDRMQRLTQELRSYRGPRVTVQGLPA